VERDLKTAVKWYHKAAEAGNSGAQFNLGNCYKRGEGYVPPPIAACPRAVAHAASAAARRLRQAGVVRENSTAVYITGHASHPQPTAPTHSVVVVALRRARLRHGRCDQNVEMAVAWYLKAAEKGVDGALNNLGISYAAAAPLAGMTCGSDPSA
jgi:TPR repeat protein